MRDCETCGSMAINHDPERRLCDCCWRDRRIAELESRVDRLLTIIADQPCECHDEYGRNLETCERCKALEESK